MSTHKGFLSCIQYTDACRTEQETSEQHEWLKTQEGYLGGRLLPATSINPAPRVQVFFEDSTLPSSPTWLPNGCKRVSIPKVLYRCLGICRFIGVSGKGVAFPSK